MSKTMKSSAKADAAKASPNELRRLVFREVLAGDVRKFQGTANDDAGSGGGARDFRFRPYEKFGGIFEKMLVGKKSETRTRGGARVPQVIYTSTVTVIDSNGAHAVKPIEFEPPTTARDGEGRLTRVSGYGLQVPNGNGGRVLLLVFQTRDGQLWLTFATEQQLEQGLWDKIVTDRLLACLAAKRAKTHAAQGFFDLDAGDSFCKAQGS